VKKFDEEKMKEIAEKIIMDIEKLKEV